MCAQNAFPADEEWVLCGNNALSPLANGGQYDAAGYRVVQDEALPAGFSLRCRGGEMPAGVRAILPLLGDEDSGSVFAAKGRALTLFVPNEFYAPSRNDIPGLTEKGTVKGVTLKRPEQMKRILAALKECDDAR